MTLFGNDVERFVIKPFPKTTKTIRKTSIWVLYGFSISISVAVVNSFLQWTFRSQKEHLLERSQVFFVGEAALFLPFLLLHLAYWSLAFAAVTEGQSRKRWLRRYREILQSSRNFFGATINSFLGVALSLFFYIFFLGLRSLFLVDTTSVVIETSKLLIISLILFVLLFFLFGALFHSRLRCKQPSSKRNSGRSFGFLPWIVFPLFWFASIAYILSYRLILTLWLYGKLPSWLTSKLLS